MKTLAHRYPRYGTIGLLMLLVMNTALLARQAAHLDGQYLRELTMWATPVCWWGYIMAVAAWLRARQGASILSGGHDRVVMFSLFSVAFWCIFEAYNIVIPGWQYINLHVNQAVRLTGYACAFATILPGMFLTAELLQSYGVFINARTRPWRWTPTRLNISMVLGVLFCLVPPFLPADIRGYCWAFVWVGFILWLEPINYRRGVQSLYRDWEYGDLSRTLQLALAGALCGLLWEFWNYWAFSKWIYIFPGPFLHIRYFEMPVIGFLGFLPFAIEFFVMFHFVSGFFTREDKLGL